MSEYFDPFCHYPEPSYAFNARGPIIGGEHSPTIFQKSNPTPLEQGLIVHVRANTDGTTSRSVMDFRGRLLEYIIPEEGDDVLFA